MRKPRPREVKWHSDLMAELVEELEAPVVFFFNLELSFIIS